MKTEEFILSLLPTFAAGVLKDYVFDKDYELVLTD